MLRELTAVIKKDLRQAKRDPRFVAPSLIVPFVLLLVYSILWTSVGGGESFYCGLVVLDDTPQAENMAAIIENMRSTTNHTWFSIQRYNKSEAERLFSEGSLIAYILIPEGFGDNISSGEKANIILFCNNINDDVVKNYIHRVEAAVLLFNQGAYSPDFNQTDAPIAIEESYSYSQTPGNLEYMGASAIMLSVIVCAVAGQALSTASEFESKAIYETLNSPSPRTAIILGHTLASIPRTLLILFITLPIVYISLDVVPIGNPIVLFLILLITILALVPFGEMIGIVTKKREQALLGSVLFSVVCFLMGGGLAPVAILPIEFRIFSVLLPITHSLTLWNRVFFLNTTTGLVFGFTALVAFWVLGTIAVSYMTGREVERC